MSIKWWKRDDPRSMIAALVAGPLIAGIWLAGCGGGGGGGMTTSTGFLLNGTVFAPNRALRSAAQAGTARVGPKANAAYGPVAGVTVEVGRTDNLGGGFTALAQTTTDSLGGYTFALPSGVEPAPTLLVRATSGSTLLENIVTGPTVNISPETTAATELLLLTARNQGVGLGRLRVGNITSFISQATAIADNALPGTSVASAVAIANSAFQSKRYAATIANDLLAVLNGAAPPPTITPGGATRTPSGGGGGGGGSTPVPTSSGGGGTGGTPVATVGRPTPTPITFPTAGPTTVPVATTTPRATATPGATTTPRPTTLPTVFGPTVTPAPTPTLNPSITPTPLTVPTPIVGQTPIFGAHRARRGR